MNSYAIYLTKSEAIAKRIALSYKGSDFVMSDVDEVFVGVADGDAHIPAIYHGKGYYCCIITLKDRENKAQEYELMIG